MPTISSSSMARARDSDSSSPMCRRMTSTIWLPMVRTGFSEVIGSWKTIAMRLPRMCRISALEILSRVASLEEDLAVDDAPRRVGDQAQDGERRHGLAAARLAHQPERLPLLEVPAHAVDGADRAVLGEEIGAQVLDLEQLGHQSPFGRSPGSPAPLLAAAHVGRSFRFRLARPARWWGRGDSNSHASRHMILNHARLPVPTLPLVATRTRVRRPCAAAVRCVW